MIKKVIIKNFRSCRNVELVFDTTVTALVGKNGAGKTNLLHAIETAAGICSGRTPIFGLAPQEPGLPVSVSLDFNLDAREYGYLIELLVGQSTPSLDVREELVEYTPGGPVSLITRRGERAESSVGPSEVKFGRLSSALPAILQLMPSTSDDLSQLEAIRSFLGNVRYHRLVDNVREHDRATPFITEQTYLQWAAQLPASAIQRDSIALRLLHLSIQDPDSFQEVKDLLGDKGLSLLSDITVDKVEISVRHAESKEATEKESAFVIRFSPATGLAGAGRTFDYSGLSAGTRRVIQLVTFLIFDTSSAMLLEQPEDSMHPGLLRKVIDVLESYAGRTQVIMTTHSPRVINLLTSRQITMVRSDGGQTLVRKLDETEELELAGYQNDQGTLAEYLETL